MAELLQTKLRKSWLSIRVMRELSLHVLDVAQNSLRANASLVTILIAEDSYCDRLVVVIEDNGQGMSKEMTAKALDPFTTTRTTRNVGLGLPMLAATTKACQGDLLLHSKEGIGTLVYAYMQRSHIDLAPLGDIATTIVSLMAHSPGCDLIYHRVVDNRHFHLDSREVKQKLQGLPISNPKVVSWLTDYVSQGEKSCVGGAL